VVNIASIVAVPGIGSNVIYCASKAAVDSITCSLARALASKIRMVSVSPSWVLGEYAKSADPAFLKLQEDLTPLSRLASKYGLRFGGLFDFYNGSIVPVDGGRLLK
jgi:3-oxoacyl-[acyl-carrier protein] reductase